MTVHLGATLPPSSGNVEDTACVTKSNTTSLVFKTPSQTWNPAVGLGINGGSFATLRQYVICTWCLKKSKCYLLTRGFRARVTIGNSIKGANIYLKQSGLKQVDAHQNAVPNKNSWFRFIIIFLLPRTGAISIRIVKVKTLEFSIE